MPAGEAPPGLLRALLKLPAELGRDPAFDCPGILNDPPGIVPGNPELGRPLLEPAMLVSWLLAVGGADVKPVVPTYELISDGGYSPVNGGKTLLLNLLRRYFSRLRVLTTFGFSKIGFSASLMGPIRFS